MINNNDNFFRRAEIERERQIITYRMKKAKDDGIELGIRKGFELGKSEGIELGKSEGIELGKSEGIELGIRHTFMKIFHAFYPNADTQWIDKCTLKQLTYATDLILKNPDYQELKQTIMKMK